MSSLDPLNDGISSVTVIDSMGNDNMVVDAARVSFAKLASNYTDEQNEKLIKYLATHNHVTPFFHPQVQFRFKMPIFVARQWYRSVIGCARNEVSRRYVENDLEMFVPDVWRARSEGSNKQGSNFDKNIPVVSEIKEHLDKVLELYYTLLYDDVAPEMARMILPQNLYTEFVETGSLAFYARVYNLRINPHAQKEIQVYAEAVGHAMSKLFPISWKYLINDR